MLQVEEILLGNNFDYRWIVSHLLKKNANSSLVPASQIWILAGLLLFISLKTLIKKKGFGLSVGQTSNLKMSP